MESIFALNVHQLKKNIKIKKEKDQNITNINDMKNKTNNKKQYIPKVFKMRTFVCKKCGMSFDSRQERKFHSC